MLDKDKLTLVVEVGVGQFKGGCSHHMYRLRMQQALQVFGNSFDDSVKVLVVPAAIRYPAINVRQLNADTMSAKQLQTVIDKADKLVKQLTECKQY